MHEVKRIGEFLYRLVLDLGYAVQDEGAFLQYPDPGFIRVIRGTNYLGMGSTALFRFPQEVMEAIRHNVAPNQPELEGVVRAMSSRRLRRDGRISDSRLAAIVVEAHFAVPRGGVGPPMRGRNWSWVYGYPNKVRLEFKLGGVPRVPEEWVREIARNIAQGDV